MRTTSTGSSNLPAVRLRISCPNLAEYRARQEPEYAERGVFISSGRVTSRPVGSRVFLRIELADRTLGYAGQAVVASHVTEGARTGCVLTLDRSADDAGDELAAEGVTLEVELPAETPAPTPLPAPAAEPGPTPAPVALPARRLPLTEDIFADDEADGRPVILPLAAAEAAPAGGPPAGADAPRPAFEFPPLVVARREVPLRLRPTPAPLPAVAVVARDAAAEPDPTAPPVARAQPPEPAPAGPRERRPGPRRSVLLLAVAAAAAIALVVAGAALARARQRDATLEASLAEAIRLADDRLQAGRLAAPPGDAAIDHLLRARALRPADRRVVTRLEMLALTFESLGRRAADRGDLQEAAAHLSGALRVDPGRESVRAELERVDARRRAQEGKRGREPQRRAGKSG